jgi:hypothetical protein
MALISVDPFQWIDAWRRTTKLFDWVRFLVSLGFTGVVSFLGACGGALIKTHDKVFAVGSGMV